MHHLITLRLWAHSQKFLLAYSRIDDLCILISLSLASSRLLIDPSHSCMCILPHTHTHTHTLTHNTLTHSHHLSRTPTHGFWSLLCYLFVWSFEVFGEFFPPR